MVLVRLVLTASILLVATRIVPGFYVENIYVALIVALVLGVLNITIKPILFILTIPITILTLGLFSLIISASMLSLAAAMVPGFEVIGFLPVFVVSLFISAMQSFLRALSPL